MTFEMISWTGESVDGKRLSRVSGIRKVLVRRRTKHEKMYADAMSVICHPKSVLWFTEQKVIHVHREQAFVLDFYFKAFKLAVEIDGSHHSGSVKSEEDAWRTRILNEHGIGVLRFTNAEVEESPSSCVEKTLDWMMKNGKGWKIRELRKHLIKMNRRR